MVVVTALAYILTKLLKPLNNQSTDGSVVSIKQPHVCVTGLNPGW